MSQFSSFFSASFYLVEKIFKFLGGGGLVACGGLWLTWVGLNTWKRQLVGGDRYKLATSILTSLYRLEQSIHLARGRGVARHKEAYAERAVEKIRKAFLKDCREPIRKSYEEFLVFIPEAKAHWGREKIDSLAESLNELVFEYWVKVDEIVEGQNLPEKYYERIKAVVWASSNKDEDEFLKKLKDVVKSFEHLLLPSIGKKRKSRKF